MAHKKLLISFDTPACSIEKICRTEGLNGKEVNEVYYSLDAIRVWKDRFQNLYGDLHSCIHHSNPDDPPDMTLIFSRFSVGVEHTRLEPQHLGWANALHLQDYPDQCVNVPSITQKPNNRRELQAIMLKRDSAWTDVNTDMSEWLRFLLGLIRKKTENQTDGLLVIQDSSIFSNDYLYPLAKVVHSILTPAPRLIQNWAVLLHSRSNPIQFDSYLIERGADLQHRSDEENSTFQATTNATNR